MTFLWTGFLYLLALIPAGVAFYALMLRRHRRFAVHYSSLVLLRDVLPRRSGVRRHLPFGLFMAALAGLIVALSRPLSIITVPASRTTIILAVDVSRSMCATDILPSRLQALEGVAVKFIRDQKPNTEIGIVAFSDIAELVQAPTTDQDALQSAVQNLITGGGTAIGSGILKSLDAIAEIDKRVVPSVLDPSSDRAPAFVPQGDYAPDIIVLLTDGVSNTGPSPLDAAQQAAERGVRVYTIGFGTAHGTAFASCQSSDPYRFRGFGGLAGTGMGGGLHRGIDESTLQGIAGVTGADYYPASSAVELESVFKQLPVNWIARHTTSEVSVFFAAGGALLAILAMALSLLWQPLP
jgi:Ca-activated chloride channel family protein